MRILVVCTANIARSPLAEAMLASRLGAAGVEVASAGTRARSGLPAAEESRLLAEARGLDLVEHRSRPVSDDLLERASLVLTMSRRQRDHCMARTAGGATTTFALAELVRLLLEEVPADGGPPDPSDRLGWLAEQAHLARPRARPAEDEDDVEDPIGRDWPFWEELGTRLDLLVWELTRAAHGAQA